MEKSQYDLCIEVLRRLDGAGIFNNVTLLEDKVLCRRVWNLVGRIKEALELKIW